MIQKTNFTAFDSQCMARALKLAEQGLYSSHPNPRVGCVIAKHERIIAEGFHEVAGEAHAEIQALNNAEETVEGATVYVTLEPCSHHGRTAPCCEALISAKVAKVIVAMQDPNSLVSGEGIQKLRAAGIQVDTGLAEAQARALNPGFIKRMTIGLPWVRSKMAMSLDGATAMASGESKWITGDAARADVQAWRARSSAIMTGVNTVIADNPGLNIRTDFHPRQAPLIRVVLDSHLRSPRDRQIFQLPGPNWIFTRSTQNVEYAGETQIIQQPGTGSLDLHEVMRELAKREVNEIIVEAGAILNGALLAQNLIDEFILYVAPKVLGDQAKGLLHLPGLKKLKDAPQMEIFDMRKIGHDMRLMARVLE